MVKDFLFEIGLEELPSKAVYAMSDELQKTIKQKLANAGLLYESIKVFASPRRLAILIKHLNEQQPTQHISRRGPALLASYDKDKKPTQALLGFAKSCGVDPENLQVKTTEKGEFLSFETELPGEATINLMPKLLEESLLSLTSFQPMRWGEGEFQFARPVHWVLMLYGSELVPAKFFSLETQSKTFGHRFHHKESITIDSPEHYEQQLEKAFVIADFEKRKQLIYRQIEAKATSIDAIAIIPEDLLNEVTSIVEWPEALLINFNPNFLQIPEPVLIESMQVHQKCFALKSKEGKLLPHFITISNIKSENEAQVIKGNEKVMQARLSDAAFFFEQDKNQSFDTWIEATKKVIFQNRLGTLFDKTIRIQRLSLKMASLLNEDEGLAKRAALLSKADLMSGMVGEFPELQGLMGYYYALEKKENKTVATAIDEQYYPRFSGDDLPKTNLGKIISIADRLDTMVGIFGIGLKPTGVKDPFKLRRHALALGRLLLSIETPLSIKDLIAAAFACYDKPLDFSCNDLSKELMDFVFERLFAYYEAKNINADKILAVRARQTDWLFDFDKRLIALTDFVNRKEAEALAAASKRVNNILQGASNLNLAVQSELFKEDAEINLYQCLIETEKVLATDYDKGNYVSILESLASLKEPIDHFFDTVMVMVDDKAIKHNRLALLAKLQERLQSVADISLLSS